MPYCPTFGGRRFAFPPYGPIAVIKPSGTYYIHADHLNTPRKIYNQQGQLVWHWEIATFGASLPNQDPSGLGAFVYNLAFAGQYRDVETGLHYNYYRDCYDPKTGRYCQTDPIGLAGGSLSLYAYVSNNPLSYIDPTGLFLDTVWDVGNVIYDVWNGEWGDAAADAAAMCIPGVPAGITKLKKATNVLPDNALVCRGGSCTADKFVNGSGVTLGADGKLNGVSVNSAAGKSLNELTTNIPHNKVGVTTVGDVRKAGGDVIPSPTASNPNHATLKGITPQQAQTLMTPTVKNPNVR